MYNFKRQVLNVKSAPKTILYTNHIVISFEKRHLTIFRIISDVTIIVKYVFLYISNTEKKSTNPLMIIHYLL